MMFPIVSFENRIRKPGKYGLSIRNKFQPSAPIPTVQIAQHSFFFIFVLPAKHCSIQYQIAHRISSILSFFSLDLVVASKSSSSLFLSCRIYLGNAYEIRFFFNTIVKYQIIDSKNLLKINFQIYFVSNENVHVFYPFQWIARQMPGG